MRSLRLTSIVVYILFIASNAFASGSGGFRVESPDAATLGKGTAFVGEANRPSAVYYNPAGLNQLKDIEISVGGAVIAPRESYKDNSGQTTQMRNHEFIIPHVYIVAPVNQKLTIGFGASSFWGLGTEWASNSFSRYVATKNDLMNTDSMFTASYQVTEQWSIAASADNDYSKVDENKNVLQSNFVDDANLSLKAKDDAWGYRLATLFKINQKNQVGLMYRSAIHHNYIGKLYLDGLNNNLAIGLGGAASYQTVFGGSSYQTRVTEKVTLPQSIVMGYSFKPSAKWTFNFDLEWMNWSRFKQEALNFPDETDATRLSVLNNGNPIKHHWHSAFSEAIGGEYAVNERLRLRTGYYHHEHVVPQGTFQSSIPDSSSHGIAAGFGFDLTKHITFDLAYSGIIYESRKINNNVGTLVGGDISGKYKQFIHTGYATLTYKF